MRYYTIKTANDRTTFKCSACSHSVATAEFDILNGHPRTQAAKAMNEHAAAAHPSQSHGVKHSLLWSLSVNPDIQDTRKRMDQDLLKRRSLAEPRQL
jgi:hypothetical protein